MRKLSLFLTFVLFIAFQAAAQNQISGTVTNAESGDPIPGVSIVVKGQTTVGTATDMDGNYSFQVPSSAEALVFSFVGMQTQEVAIQGRTQIDVALEPSVEEMEEVVVLGYTERGKNQITGSSVQVDGEELDEVPTTTIQQGLQGKVAGVKINTNSGTPGAVQDVRIRGRGSITAGNEPLYVIDGVPMVSGNFGDDGAMTSFSILSSLNSSDIKSVTVLKDASATSAYGARGSNGVIVIETKQGQAGDTQITLNTSYGFQNNAVEGRQALSGAQRFELYNEAVYNTFGEAYGFTEDEAWDFASNNGLYGSWQYTNWIDQGKPDISWEDALANDNAPVTKATLSASGGDDVSNFYASLGYNKSEATVIGGEFERISGNLNYERDISDNVTFNTDLSLNNTHQEGILEQSAYFASPHAAKYFMPNVAKPYVDGEPNTDLPGSNYNPIYLEKHNVNFNELSRITNHSSVRWNIVEDLTFTSKFNMDYSQVRYKDFGNRNYGDSKPENGTLYESVRRNFNSTWQNSLDYEFTLAQDHNFDVKLLTEYQQNTEELLWGFGENFPADGLTTLSSASANQETSSWLQDWMNLSYLGMVNYNYMGRYIVDLTYRREGSSRFAEENRFGDFYAIGAAWNISQEPFMSGMDLFSNLRIRGSWGTSGSAEIALNRYQALLSYDAKYNETGAPYPSQLANSALSWEKNSNYDVGVDFGLFEGRISGSLAYYNKNTFDLLQDVPLSYSTGFTSFLSNVGTMVNKGVETELSFDIVRSDDFNINLSGNFSTVNNEVTELAQDPNGDDINIQNYAKKVEVGKPAWSWMLKKWAGVDTETGAPMWYVNGKGGETTTDYNAAEKAYQGASALPTYNGGISLHIDYKGVYLNANGNFAGGHKILERWAEYYMHRGLYPTGLFQGMEHLMDRWQEPGDEAANPKRVYAFSPLDSEPSTRWLYDGDYFRLTGLTLGYNLPSNLAERIGASSIRVYARATNYFTWVKDDGLKYDPETRANGYTRLNTPAVKSIIFGLNLKL